LTRRICSDFGISSYPTVKFFPAGSKPEDYKGPREEGPLTQYARKKGKANKGKAKKAKKKKKQKSAKAEL
jgi:thioredoxin-like negative regulator of GroEL